MIRLEIVSRKLSLPLLILVTIVTVLFGLWPLDFFPENRVRWLDGQDGIQFYKPNLASRRDSGGVIYSDTPIVKDRSESGVYEPATIEVFLESHEKKSGGLSYIVSFHDDFPRSPLIITQWKSYLVIRSRDNQNDARNTFREIGLKDGLIANEKKLITIASGPERTEIYVNGEPAESYEVLSLIGVEHFSGYLNLGNSSIGCHGWTGNLYGLAMYDTLLTPEQIRQNYRLWADRSVEVSKVFEPEPMILYTFAERTGAMVHDQAGKMNNLTIPAKFKSLKRLVILQFWRSISWNKWIIKDILINIFGFFSFAWCLLIFLTEVKRVPPGKAAFITVLVSAILSLVIEISQFGLPTRTPSLLDVLCNTAGAALGIVVFRIIVRMKNEFIQGQRSKLYRV